MGWLEDALGYMGIGGQQQEDPYSLSSLMPSTEPLMSSGPAYDFSSPSVGLSPVASAPVQQDYSFQSMLGDLAKQTSAQIDGITAQNDSLRAERESLDSWAENNWGQVGAGAVGAIAAALAGGSVGDIASGGYGMGNSYYNNLEAQEKLKVLRLDKLIDSNVSSINDLRNYGQSMNTAALSSAAQADRDLRTGAIPGTPAAELVRQQKREDVRLARDENDPYVTYNGKTQRKSEWALETSERRLQATESREVSAENERRAKKDLPKTIAGYNVAWEEGAEPDQHSKEKFTDKAFAYADAKAATEAFYDEVKRVGNATTGVDYTRLAGLAAEAGAKMAIAKEAGATITPTEALLKVAAIGRTLVANPISTNLDLFKATLRDEDPLTGAKMGIQDLDRSLNSLANTYKIKLTKIEAPSAPNAPGGETFAERKARLRADMERSR